MFHSRCLRITIWYSGSSMKKHGPRAPIGLLRPLNSSLNKFKFATLKANRMSILIFPKIQSKNCSKTSIRRSHLRDKWILRLKSLGSTSHSSLTTNSCAMVLLWKLTLTVSSTKPWTSQITMIAWHQGTYKSGPIGRPSTARKRETRTKICQSTSRVPISQNKC